MGMCIPGSGSVGEERQEAGTWLPVGGGSLHF